MLTLGIAAGCGVWILWTSLRPFVTRVASACGVCTGCEPARQDEAAPQPDLVQIEPVD